MKQGRLVNEQHYAMGFEEIGKALGISGNTARLIYIGAIRKLKRRKRDFHQLKQTIAFHDRHRRGKGVWEQWRDWA